MNKIYKIAIVGYGGMGRYHAKNLLKGNDRINIAGTFDISEERKIVSENDGFKVYETLEAVLSDAEIDIVLVVTPNDSHKRISISALNNGKHVICEKPVTINSSDLEEIISCAENNNRLFMVHQNRRWDEDFQAIQKIYTEQSIGEIFHFESRVQGANGIPGDWRRMKEHGGGMLWDWGVHLLDQLLFMVDSEIESVYCSLSFILGNGVDDGFQTFITFKNGYTALIEVGTTNFVQLPRWYVKGTSGSAVIHNWHMNGEMVVQNNAAEMVAPEPIRAGRGLTKTMAPPSEQAIMQLPLPAPVRTMEEFYDNVVSSIEGTSKPVVKNHEVLRVVRLIEKMFESAERNEVIRDFDN